MHAVQYFKYGGPEQLKLDDLPLPLPQKGEVRVQVIAASVNSWDWDKLTGKPYLYRLLSGLFQPRLSILGCDIAGIVEAVGPEVTRFKVGDAVFGDISASWGGFAAFVCVSEKNLTLKPAFIDFNAAAALPHTGELAYQALFKAAQLKKGDQLLLIGGGGGTGSFALQFAKNAGAEVTVVDNRHKKAAVLSWGADAYIDYQQEAIWASDKQYDLIIDMVANQSPRKYVKALKKGGQLVIVGGKPGTMLQIAFLGRLYVGRQTKKLGFLIHQPNQNLETLLNWYETGQFQVHIAQTYSLAQLPQAMTDLHLAQKAGKLVIEVGKV